MREQYGFGSIKFKGGVLEPVVEVETIRQLRQALGQAVPLRIDPNCAWSVDTSVKVGQDLAEELSKGGYLEDPCVGLDGMAEVRRRLLADGIDTPLASNVAVTSFGDIPEAVRQDAVQVVLCDHHYWGGMRQVQQLARVCRTFGIGLSMHSNSHLGVSLMAMAHVASATSHLTYACDTHYPWQSAIDEIAEGGRIPIVEGCVAIPDKPGLGVSLDYDQLERGNGPSLVAAAKAQQPSLRCLMLIQRPLLSTIHAAAKAQCEGLCSHERIGNGGLLSVLRAMESDGSHMDPVIAGVANHNRGPKGTAHPLSDVLSLREEDVLRGLCKGLSNQEIAKVLSSSERTVKRKLAFAKAFLAKVLLKHSAGATP